MVHFKEHYKYITSEDTLWKCIDMADSLRLENYTTESAFSKIAEKIAGRKNPVE